MKTEKSVSHKDSVTVAFRVSREDYNQIQMLADISGLVKQDYLLSRALNQEITVYPNIRIKKYLEQYLTEVLEELIRIKNSTVDEPCLRKLENLIAVISNL